MSKDFRHQDPYRAARKTPSQDDYYEAPSVHSISFHSRSVSESSTSKLTGKEEDPYERIKSKKKRGIEEKRANSYLPYTNHLRDPFSAEPIHLQEDTNTHMNQRGPIGSILQDNLVIDLMNNQDSFYRQEDDVVKKQNINSTLIPPVKKKKWYSRYSKRLLFITILFAVIIAVIWYFVWPRTPQLKFVNARLANNNIEANYTKTSMIASWQVNFTVINTNNWIPTKLHNLAIEIVEETTDVVFGSGNSGSLTLTPRSSAQVISVPIQINYVKDVHDATLTALLYACATINQNLSTSSKQTLNVHFNIVYYIAGLVWHPNITVTPQTYFQCP